MIDLQDMPVKALARSNIVAFPSMPLRFYGADVEKRNSTSSSHPRTYVILQHLQHHSEID